jgi:hypothetical protein
VRHRPEGAIKTHRKMPSPFGSQGKKTILHPSNRRRPAFCDHLLHRRLRSAPWERSLRFSRKRAHRPCRACSTENILPLHLPLEGRPRGVPVSVNMLASRMLRASAARERRDAAPAARASARVGPAAVSDAPTPWLPHLPPTDLDISSLPHLRDTRNDAYGFAGIGQVAPLCQVPST